ncbi:MAG: hypothetical protein Q4D38_14460 [Planctomycetia bacterium]|nr:hypothetical protein [Planctomycetia bacterium]MDO4571584.1 hypothetical protein [Planctomycetia bacterium]
MMQDWAIFGGGFLASILIAESGQFFDVPAWVTTIGPWGVMYLVVERLTTSHARAIADLAKSVNNFAVILAKVEGIKFEKNEQEKD